MRKSFPVELVFQLFSVVQLALVLFFVGHVAMVVLTGAGRQLRAMILGR